jgi:hypothetical protein
MQGKRFFTQGGRRGLTQVALGSHSAQFRRLDKGLEMKNRAGDLGDSSPVFISGLRQEGTQQLESHVRLHTVPQDWSQASQVSRVQASMHSS